MGKSLFYWFAIDLKSPSSWRLSLSCGHEIQGWNWLKSNNWARDQFLKGQPISISWLPFLNFFFFLIFRLKNFFVGSSLVCNLGHSDILTISLILKGSYPFGSHFDFQSHVSTAVWPLSLRVPVIHVAIRVYCSETASSIMFYTNESHWASWW